MGASTPRQSRFLSFFFFFFNPDYQILNYGDDAANLSDGHSLVTDKYCTPHYPNHTFSKAKNNTNQAK